MAPSGMSIRSPWLAIIITVPFNDTRLPNVTSPDTVKWSSSRISGIVANRPKNSCTCTNKKLNSYHLRMEGPIRRVSCCCFIVINITFLKWLSPSLISGVVWNIRSGDMTRTPFLRVYKLLIINKRSWQVLTGKNLDRGTFTPLQFSKHWNTINWYY